MKSIWRPLAVGALVLAGLLDTTCKKSSDPVRDCLDDLARATHDRDSKTVFERLTSDFQAEEGSSRADAQAIVRRYFAAYEALDVSLSDVTIERSENAARARFRAELSGRPRKIGGLDALFPRSSAYDFDIRLVPEEGKWRVSWASWHEASR